MNGLTQRTTIYLAPELHKALRLKSIETSRSVSEIVNNAILQALAEDADDLAAFKDRAAEPEISFEKALKELRGHGRL
ncbi:MAG: CopG family transcriptional regulator [Deltaproteobacteria bacterium]|nr:CopG family transcriptional regulator [Deltaproteobacteria bacterium]